MTYAELVEKLNNENRSILDLTQKEMAEILEEHLTSEFFRSVWLIAVVHYIWTGRIGVELTQRKYETYAIPTQVKEAFVG